MVKDRRKSSKFYYSSPQITRKTMSGPRNSRLPIITKKDHNNPMCPNPEMISKNPQQSDISILSEECVQQKKTAKKFLTSIEGKIKITSEIESFKNILCCKYDEELKTISGGFVDGSIHVYDVNTSHLISHLCDKEVEIDTAPVTEIQHRPVSSNYPISNTFTCCYANGCVKCWSPHYNQCLYTIRERRQTFGIKYHNIQPKFVTYGDNGKLYLYDEETKTLELILQGSENKDRHDGHMSRVFAACFKPNSNFELISGGWDDVIQFWDLRLPHAVRHISGVHMCGEGIDINVKGTEILVAAWQTENPLQMYDYGTGKLITSLEPDVHNSKLYCGRYVAKDFIITGGTDPNIIRVIDLQTYMTVASIVHMPGAIYGFDLGPTHKKRQDKIEPTSRASDISTVPRVAFISGKKIYQIDFL